MSTEKHRLTIRASASRLNKGLLAIPQKFRSLFPDKRGLIGVFFDDGVDLDEITFQPNDPGVKESRILGLARWFSTRGVREGDLISVTIEDQERRLYRIALDRYVLERQELKARDRLEAAETDSEADRQLTRKRPRAVAKLELLRIAGSSAPGSRPIVLPPWPSGTRSSQRAFASFFANCMMASASFVPLPLKSVTESRILRCITSIL